MKLYVLVKKSEGFNITRAYRFLKGGGSSSKSYVRAFDTLEGAKRAKGQLGGEILEFNEGRKAE